VITLDRFLPFDSAHALPKSLFYGMLFVCIFPTLLNLAGVDFGSEIQRFDPVEHLNSDSATLLAAQFSSLAGAIEHTLMEWTAFCIAAFVVVLAMLHYRISGDVTTPIIGVAFFMSGCMDAFHTLAADHLIGSVADQSDLVPFTWAICRSFNALILISGVLILLLRSDARDSKQSFGFVVGVSILFGVVAYLIIHFSATSPELPQTMFADAWITRPYDVLPLLLFVVAGLFIYPMLYRKRPSVFAYALIISAIPETITQLHMVFGSTALFDNHFNIAHFLKIVAYSMPLAGLMVDYVQTHQRLQQSALEQQRISTLLLARNDELQAYAHTISHDLRAPLRAIEGFSDALDEDYRDQLNEEAHEYLTEIRAGVSRMDLLINDLLLFARLGGKQDTFHDVDLNEMLELAKENLATDIKERQASIVVVSKLPVVQGHASTLQSALMNLLSNAIKFTPQDRKPDIAVTVSTRGPQICLSVSDHGIGIEEKYWHSIFDLFSRLHTDEAYPGTGVGLAIVKKAALQHGGEAWLQSVPGQGSTFHLSLAYNSVDDLKDVAEVKI